MYTLWLWVFSTCALLIRQGDVTNVFVFEIELIIYYRRNFIGVAEIFFKNKLLRLLCKLSGIFLFDLIIPSQKHCIYTSWCSWSLKKVVKENNLPNLLLYWTPSSRKIASSTTRPVEKWTNFFIFLKELGNFKPFQVISPNLVQSADDLAEIFLKKNSTGPVDELVAEK